HQEFSLPPTSPLPRSYDVVACAECEFVFADTPGTVTDYESHYAESSKYQDPVLASGSGGNALDGARIAAMADLLVTLAGRSARILDIGCGAGGLLSE